VSSRLDRPVFLEQQVEINAGGGFQAKEVLSIQCGRQVVLAMDELLDAFEIIEKFEGLFMAIDVAKYVDLVNLFFEYEPEVRDTAIAIGGTDKGRIGASAKESQVGQEGPGDELTTIIMTQLQSNYDGLRCSGQGTFRRIGPRLSSRLLQVSWGRSPLGLANKVLHRPGIPLDTHLGTIP